MSCMSCLKCLEQSFPPQGVPGKKKIKSNQIKSKSIAELSQPNNSEELCMLI